MVNTVAFVIAATGMAIAGGWQTTCTQIGPAIAAVGHYQSVFGTTTCDSHVVARFLIAFGAVVIGALLWVVGAGLPLEEPVVREQ